jgi:hypothetical protein
MRNLESFNVFWLRFDPAQCPAARQINSASAEMFVRSADAQNVSAGNPF